MFNELLLGMVILFGNLSETEDRNLFNFLNFNHGYCVNEFKLYYSM